MAVEDSETASFLARNLLCHYTGKTREQTLADSEMYASAHVGNAIEAAVQRLLQGEPLAYILGEWDFYGLRLQVTQNVLIPRDDTCAVTDLAIQQALRMDYELRILDLCTGSGCIGLAVASHIENARVTLADVSQEALAVAKKNVTALKLNSRVSCVKADALSEPASFLGTFDMIISNPPYITAEEMKELPTSVKDFEPNLALYGGEDGLDFYRSIASRYCKVLKPGGYLCFEFGMGQGDAVCGILEENGYTILERSRDYNDRERAVIAQYGRKNNDGYKETYL